MSVTGYAPPPMCTTVNMVGVYLMRHCSLRVWSFFAVSFAAEGAFLVRINDVQVLTA